MHRIWALGCPNSHLMHSACLNKTLSWQRCKMIRSIISRRALQLELKCWCVSVRTFTSRSET